MKVSKASSLESAFETNVFINCPFDKKYYALLRPLLFTVVALGFTPRIALERSDSGETRIDKICQLIHESRLSIHDLSRLKPGGKQFARMNMPFELGLDYGSRRFGGRRLKSKQYLILGSDRYDYQKALSDLSGIDIKSHDDEPENVVRAVRDWFLETANVRPAPTTKALWYNFADFTSAVYDERKQEGFSDADLEMMPIPEYVDFLKRWTVKALTRRARSTPRASSSRRTPRRFPNRGR